MTDPADLVRPDAGQNAHLIHVVDPKGYDAWLADQPDRHRAALVAQGFKPTGYAYAILPGEKADDWSVVTCVANVASFSSWCLAKLAEVLPEGHYRLAAGDPGPAVLGWMTVAKGIALMTFPQSYLSMGQGTFTGTAWWTISVVIMALIGLYLTVIGWAPNHRSGTSAASAATVKTTADAIRHLPRAI